MKSLIDLESRDLGGDGGRGRANSRFESLGVELVDEGVHGLGGGEDRVG